jgi:hypothetical protein
MNRDDVLRMAREAGFVYRPEDEHVFAAVVAGLERFAALVAAHEREECAKVCDSHADDQWSLYKGRPPYTGREDGRASKYTEGQSDGAESCAAAIRARGES